ncbi:multidrug efflux MFS transporter NorA [Niallia sp. XMNu-256]|uniref:multidrug efflux MFS transporter NorA n=1 Tax=Niallia sp. XMNu-256 TaxID=3082444 RepID=UPI0030CA996E
MVLQKNKKVTLTILLGNLFLAFLGIGLVIPVMPTLMHELHISGSTMGYLVAMFALFQLIVSPLAGKWVDQYGRKIIIIIGLIIFGISEFIFGVGESVPVLFFSRALGGISAAFIMPAVTAFLADITTRNERSKALGYMSAAINTGFIIGPGIGGFLAEVHTRLPFFVAAILGVVGAILSFLLLKEPERVQHKETQLSKRLEKKDTVKKVFQPLYFIPFILILISSFGLAAFESLVSLFVDVKFAFTPKDIAIVVMGGGLFGAIAQLFLFDRMARKFGEISVVLYCLILSSALTFIMTMVQSYWGVVLATFILFVGFDLFRPAITTYLSKIAGNEQGFVGGMNSMFTSIGNIFGPILGGALFDINVNYPYYFATAVLVLGIFIALYWKKRSTTNPFNVSINEA